MNLVKTNSRRSMLSNLMIGCFVFMPFLQVFSQVIPVESFKHVHDSLVAQMVYLDSICRDSSQIELPLSRLEHYRDLFSTVVNLYDINLHNDEHAKRYSDLATKLALEHEQGDDLVQAILMFPTIDSDTLSLRIQQVDQLLPTSEKKEGVMAHLRYLYYSSLLAEGSGVDSDSLINNVLRHKGSVIFDDLANRYERFYVMRTVIEGANDIGPTSAAYRYMLQLSDVVQGLPRANSYMTLDFLQFQVYVHTQNEEPIRAIKVLQIWKRCAQKREKYLRSKYNRPFYDLGVVYGDMAVLSLLNYKAISKAQVDSCYRSINDAMDRYPVLKKDYAHTSAYKLCYYLGMGNKKEALRWVRRMIKEEDFIDMSRLRVYRVYSELCKELAISEYKKALVLYVAELEKTYEFVRRANQKDNLVFFRLQQLQTETHHLAERTRMLEEIKEEQIEHSYRIIVTLLLVIIFAVLGMSALIYSRNRKIVSHEKKLQEALRKAEVSNELQTRFLHNMSHEIRTPLNAIVGFSEVLAEDDELLDEERKEYRERIVMNNELLMQIIDDILDVARLESGSYQMTKEKTLVNKLCKRALASVSHKCSPEVELCFHSECDDDFEYMTDPHRLIQILINLLNNATKYTKSGKIELDVKFGNEDKLYFSITDTGSGIPDELIDSLFDRFSKGQEFTQGTGLGLNICRMLTEMFGGSIYLDKTYKTGARFVLEMPVES